MDRTTGNGLAADGLACFTGNNRCIDGTACVAVQPPAGAADGEQSGFSPHAQPNVSCALASQSVSIRSKATQSGFAKRKQADSRGKANSVTATNNYDKKTIDE